MYINIAVILWPWTTVSTTRFSKLHKKEYEQRLILPRCVWPTLVDLAPNCQRFGHMVHKSCEQVRVLTTADNIMIHILYPQMARGWLLIQPLYCIHQETGRVTFRFLILQTWTIQGISFFDQMILSDRKLDLSVAMHCRIAPFCIRRVFPIPLSTSWTANVQRSPRLSKNLVCKTQSATWLPPCILWYSQEACDISVD